MPRVRASYPEDPPLATEVTVSPSAPQLYFVLRTLSAMVFADWECTSFVIGAPEGMYAMARDLAPLVGMLSPGWGAPGLGAHFSRLAAHGSQLTAQGLGLWAEGSGIWGQGSGLRAQGSGLRAQGSGFAVGGA